jgi:hypothetical protein
MVPELRREGPASMSTPSSMLSLMSLTPALVRLALVMRARARSATTHLARRRAV